MRIFWIVAKTAVSGLILFVVFRSVSAEALSSRIGAMDAGPVAAAVLVNLFQSGLGAYRWRVISGRIFSGLRFAVLLRFWLIGQFLSQALPSTIGGDGIRIWMLYRHGVSIRDATHSVVADRVSGMLVLLLLVASTLPFHAGVIPDHMARLTLQLVAAAGLGGFVGLLALASPLGLGLNRFRPTRIVRDLAHTLLDVLGRSRSAVGVFVIAFVVQVLSVLAIYLLAIGLKLPVGFWSLLILVPPMQLLSMVPISIAGWGLREGLMVTVLGFVGVPADGALVLSVFYGLSLVLASLPGGPLLVVNRSEASPPAGEPAGDPA